MVYLHDALLAHAGPGQDVASVELRRRPRGEHSGGERSRWIDSDKEPGGPKGREEHKGACGGAACQGQGHHARARRVHQRHAPEEQPAAPAAAPRPALSACGAPRPQEGGREGDPGGKAEGPGGWWRGLRNAWGGE